jgi:DNA polymerase III epsilon subunit-like protein
LEREVGRDLTPCLLSLASVFLLSPSPLEGEGGGEGKLLETSEPLNRKMRKYVVFDVETTGLRIWRNDMTGPIQGGVSA